MVGAHLSNFDAWDRKTYGWNRLVFSANEPGITVNTDFNFELKDSSNANINGWLIAYKGANVDNTTTTYTYNIVNLKIFITLLSVFGGEFILWLINSIFLYLN